MLKGGPSLNRLVKTGNDHALLVDEKVLAVAEERTQWKSIRVSGGAEYSLVCFSDAAVGDCLLLDEANNVVASIAAAQGLMPTKLSNGAGLLIAVVRTDGCGGLHALQPNGDVLFYLGRSLVSPSITDVLLTDAGLALPLISQFALMVSLKTQHSHLFSA